MGYPSNSKLDRTGAMRNDPGMKRTFRLLGDSFSTFGNKSLEFTDKPDKFIHFSDSGTLFSNRVYRTLSFKHYCDFAEGLVVPNSSSIYGKIEIDAGKYALFISPSSEPCLDPESMLEFLMAWWEPYSIPKLWFPAKVKSGEAATFKASLAGSFQGESSLWKAELLGGYFFYNDFLPIRLEVNGQRVTVQVLNCAPTELPLSSLSISLTGKSLECRNRLLIENKTLSGFKLEFLTPEMATEYLEKLGLVENLCIDDKVATTQTALVGLIGQVRVDGIIAGRPIDPSLCDARIDSNTLTVLDRSTGAPICALDLGLPNLAIDGTAEEFVVSPNYSTAIRITSDSKDFLLAVYQNRATQDVATRTSRTGPFIATNDDGFVRIESRETGATISVNGSEPTDIQTNIAEPTLSFSTKRPTVHVGDFELRAELPSLEGIFATLKGLTVKASVAANFGGAIAQIVGLEGHYLTYCAFGKFAHAHLVIANALSVDPTASLAALTSTQEKERFLAIMAQFAGVLTRDCETILHYFPRFILEQDRAFLSSSELLNRLDLGRTESCYQIALRTYGSLAPHLFRIENTMSRFGSFRKASTKPDGWASFAPLGVSLAGSLLNPFLLIGAVQQGVSLANREEAKTSMAADTLNDAFESCAQEWDFLMQTVLPFVASRFAQDIYPVRLSIANILLKAYGEGDVALKAKLTDLVSQRLGRLITFREFPSASSSEISRLKCVDFLFEIQKIARGIDERPF